MFLCGLRRWEIMEKAAAPSKDVLPCQIVILKSDFLIQGRLQMARTPSWGGDPERVRTFGKTREILELAALCGCVSRRSQEKRREKPALGPVSDPLM